VGRTSFFDDWIRLRIADRRRIRQKVLRPGNQGLVFRASATSVDNSEGVSGQGSHSISSQGEENSVSQTLQYKGYDGSVEYSAKDRVLHGSLLGIRDAIVYEGVDVDSLESNFRAAVDEYLAFCAAEDKAPDQPFKGSFNVRVGSELHKRAALFAEAHNQKLNSVVSKALEEFLIQAR
jgi:predicted HicB family RNase H-like nuclease